MFRLDKREYSSSPCEDLWGSLFYFFVAIVLFSYHLAAFLFLASGEGGSLMFLRIISLFTLNTEMCLFIVN